MNTASSWAGSSIWTPLQSMLGWLKARAGSLGGTAHEMRALAGAPTAADALPARIEQACHSTFKRRPQRRALRIVRILESDMASTQVGRMVISGRMSDVCAELDRLAACEALPH